MRRDRGWRLVPGEGPLAKVRPIAAFLLVAAVFTVGVLLRGVAGAALLVVLAVLVGLLLAAAWPRLTVAERALRLLVLLAVIAVAISVLG